MIIKKMAKKVNNIRQAAGTNGLPGNYIVNPAYDDKNVLKPESWFNSREIRNSLLGSNVNAALPCFLLNGCTITYEQLTVEQSDIDAAKAAGKDAFEYKLQARKEPVKYKQPGVHNINAAVDMRSLPFELQMAIADLSMKHRSVRTMTPVPATTEDAEEIIDETINEDEKTDDEKIAHDELTDKDAVPAEEEKK